jgi:hypothetical protein
MQAYDARGGNVAGKMKTENRFIRPVLRNPNKKSLELSASTATEGYQAKPRESKTSQSHKRRLRKL